MANTEYRPKARVSAYFKVYYQKNKVAIIQRVVEQQRIRRAKLKGD